MTTATRGRENGYELIARLASGGMGEIFVARMVRAGGFRKLCVIKRVLPQYAGSENFTAMLLEEARVAAQMTHSNICQVYDFGLMDGHYFMAMEYLAGVSIGEMLRHYSSRRERIDERMVAAIIYQACMGLEYAHNVADLDGRLLEIVHRDISPSNLMVTTSGVVKVLDFGIAKSKDQRTKTKSGVLKGKVGYMAPEQIEGASVDLRADIFSIGVVMAEMFSGRRLFPIGSEYETFKAIVEGPIPSLDRFRPDLPPKLVAVADRALARDPADRFRSAGEMGEALAEAMVPLGGLMSDREIQRVLSSDLPDQLASQRALLTGSSGELLGTDIAAVNTMALPDAGTTQTRAMTSPPQVRPLVPNPLAAGAEIAPTVARPLPGATALPRRFGKLAVLVGIPALVSAAIVVLLVSRQGGVSHAAPTSVVVYQTELPAPATGGDGAAAAPETAAEAAEPPASEADGADGAEARPAAAPPRARRRAVRDRYKEAIARRRSALLGCFERVTSLDGAPEIQVRMRLARSGRPQSVSVLPESVASTPLGHCVAGEVRGIDFGRHDEPVTVTVPLVIRSK